MKETQDYTPVVEPRSPSEMSSYTQDQLILLTAQRQEKQAREDLVYSLTTMGAFEEALAIAETDEKKAEIQSLIDGENAPDDERCECVHTIDLADYALNPQAAPILKEAPKYLPQFRHWSRKYRAMVWLRKCHICNHTQTILGEMDSRYAARAVAFRKAHEVALDQGAKVRESTSR